MSYCIVCSKPEVEELDNHPLQEYRVDFPKPLCTQHREMLYHYNKMHKNKFTHDFNRIIALAKSLNAKTILEIGCGAGFFFRNYKEKLRDFEYTGVDKRETSIKIAKTFNPEARFRKINVYTDSLEERYDIAFARHVMLHQKDLEEFLHCLSLLGKVVVCMENYDITKVAKTIIRPVKNEYFHGEHSPNTMTNQYTKTYLQEICKRLKLKCEIDMNWLTITGSL